MPKNNSKLKVNPTEITFAETMEVIEKKLQLYANLFFNGRHQK